MLPLSLDNETVEWRHVFFQLILSDDKKLTGK